jgi:hypothetical protein
MTANKQAKNNCEQTKGLWHETLKGFRTWYIVNLFVTLYLMVLLTYYAFSVYSVSLSNIWGNIFAFLTSPFNLTEVFAKVYNSPMEGYLLNGVFTFLIISVSIIYYNLFASSKRIKPEIVFWTSIIASYLVSITVWLFTGAPSTGTSIIGFSMVGFLLVSSLNDLRVYFSKNRNHPSKLTIAKVFTIASITFFSLIIAVASYSLGTNAYIHFGGGAICAVLIFTAIKAEKIGNSEITLRFPASRIKKR